MNNQEKIIINSRKNIVCDIIATYTNEITNKNYIIYTDNTYDKENKLKVYSSLYKKINNKIELIDIVENEDRKVILKMLQSLINEIK